MLPHYRIRKYFHFLILLTSCCILNPCLGSFIKVNWFNGPPICHITSPLCKSIFKISLLALIETRIIDYSQPIAQMVILFPCIHSMAFRFVKFIIIPPSIIPKKNNPTKLVLPLFYLGA